MNSIRAFFARVAGFFTGHRGDDDMIAEMQAHLEMETEENIRRGMDPESARRAARLTAGGMTQAAEAVHDQRGLPSLESLLSDIRYAFRSLRRAPGFSAIVIITLALGIGANTAIFSVVRGVLLKPLPHHEGDRLVYLRQSSDNSANMNFSVPEVRDFRSGTPSLGGIAEYSPWSGALQSDNEAVRINSGLVTGNYFEVMGLSPALGRLTRPSDDGAGVPAVMVLTHEFWMRRFGGDSSIVGKQLRLDGTSVEVIGVVQPAPFFPLRMDVLTNMVVSPHHISATMVEGRTHRMTEMVARLAPGATVEQARSEVETVYSRLKGEHTEAYNAASHPTVAVLPFKEAIGERAQLTLWLLMGAAAFVMIIATANVANLTLMRGVRREHELVVRASLGAGVARLRRLLLTENLLLSLVGSGLGVLIAVAGVPLLVGLASRFSPRSNEVHLDGTVLAFTLGVAVVVAIVFSFIGSIPGERMLSTVSSGGRRSGGSKRKQRVQRGLVVVQVAVSVMLLAGAGLLTRTMLRLAEVQTGLRTEEIVSMQVNLLSPAQILQDPTADAAAKVRYEEMRAAIAALPGVEAVGIGSNMPLRASGVSFGLKVDGRAPVPGQPDLPSDMRTADPGYFDAAGIPLIAGRVFESTDQLTSGKVVIINKVLADRLFPGEDPIGKRVALQGPTLRFTPFTGEWRTIVGVTGSTQDGGLDAKPRTAFFLPFTQVPAIGGGFVIRADSNAAALIVPATRIVRGLAPTTPIENVMTVKQYKARSVAPWRLNATLVSSFGILAVLIAAVGIAGVLAFSVSARTNEIGIRMSLGAATGQVQRMILREGGMLVGLGLVIGVGGAYVATRAIQGLLFGVTPHDPVTFGAVAAVMAVIGILACWIPARRAAKVDPMTAIRA
jgi:putative ABC transport system permease protein